MLITVKLTRRTNTTESWLIERGNTLHRTTTDRIRKQRAYDTIRYAINKTLKLNSIDYMFLGNRRHNGYWITEWMQVNENTRNLGE